MTKYGVCFKRIRTGLLDLNINDYAFLMYQQSALIFFACLVNMEVMDFWQPHWHMLKLTACMTSICNPLEAD